MTAPLTPGSATTYPVAESAVSAALTLPSSKSITNRALPLAAVASGTSNLGNVLVADDAAAMVEALIGLGFDVVMDWPSATATIHGSGGRIPATEASVACGEGATVARFLLALCAAGHGVYHFDGGPSLRRRPMKALIDVLERAGCEIEATGAGTLPLTLRTRGIHGGTVGVDSSASSQYLSSLLMALPLAAEPSEIVSPVQISEPYVDLTLSVMRDFGVEVVRSQPDGRFVVPAPRTYAATDMTMEADASTASYFFAAAAVTGGTVTIRNLSRRRCRQGDIRFLDVLESMGCMVVSDDHETTLRGPDQLQGVDADFRHITDTFMTLACIAPFADAPTTIRGIAHTRLKESDRIAATIRNLRALDIRAEEMPDGMRIFPSQPTAGLLDAYLDHRQVMSFALIGLRTPAVQMLGSECVAKTCPNFFELWEQMLSAD